MCWSSYHRRATLSSASQNIFFFKISWILSLLNYLFYLKYPKNLIQNKRTYMDKKSFLINNIKEDKILSQPT